MRAANVGLELWTPMVAEDAKMGILCVFQAILLVVTQFDTGPLGWYNGWM